MPYSTGIKVKVDDTLYQNKEVEQFPTADISADRVPDLKPKNQNQIFQALVTMRVKGIEERNIGGDNRETFYTLELREMGVVDKDLEDMTAEEIEARIEEKQ